MNRKKRGKVEVKPVKMRKKHARQKGVEMFHQMIEPVNMKQT